MTGRDAYDETDEAASRIVAGSRSAAVAGAVIDAAGASIDGARSVALGRRLAAEARAMPARERLVCALIVILAALAGHVVMASRLPLPARPAVWLSAAALLAASLAALAATARSR